MNPILFIGLLCGGGMLFFDLIGKGYLLRSCTAIFSIDFTGIFVVLFM